MAPTASPPRGGLGVGGEEQPGEEGLKPVQAVGEGHPNGGREDSQEEVEQQFGRVANGAFTMAAAPAASRTLSRSSGSRSRWPTADPRDHPTWTIGPTMPADPPEPSTRDVAASFTAATRGRHSAALKQSGQQQVRYACPSRLLRQAVDQDPRYEPTGGGQKQDEERIQG